MDSWGLHECRDHELVGATVIDSSVRSGVYVSAYWRASCLCSMESVKDWTRNEAKSLIGRFCKCGQITIGERDKLFDKIAQLPPSDSNKSTLLETLEEEEVLGVLLTASLQVVQWIKQAQTNSSDSSRASWQTDCRIGRRKKSNNYMATHSTCQTVNSSQL